MPGVTSPRSYPFPVDADPIDVAGDIKKLAEKLDDDVTRLFTWATTVRTQFNRIPLFQSGLWNGTSDGNGYCRIPQAPGGGTGAFSPAYVGLGTGDNGNQPGYGVACIQARGAGGVVDVPASHHSLGAFNNTNALVRVYNPAGITQPNAYCVFHWLAWGTNPSPVPAP